jgi:hypothetical protein
MLWRDHKLFDVEFWSGLSRILSVTGFTILVTYIMVTIVPLQLGDRGFIRLAAKLLAIIIPTFAVHIYLSSLFGLEEVRPVIDRLRRIVLKPVQIQ